MPIDARRQPTLTNEDELESARVKSMALSESPGPSSSGSLLNLANAYASEQAPMDLPESGAGSEAGGLPQVPDAHSKDPTAEMRDKFSLGDYSGALFVAEGLLEDDPANPEALRYAENCRAVLQKMYTARIGPLDRVPIVVVPRDQLRWLSIDHRAGFVLSLVDGVSSLEMVLDVSGMPLLDVLRILYELVQQRVIAFR